MPMRLKLAKPAEGNDGAKVFVDLISHSNKFQHNLKLHQDAKGKWWPELAVDLTGCSSTDIQSVRVAIVEALTETTQLISSSDCESLKDIAGLVSGFAEKEVG